MASNKLRTRITYTSEVVDQMSASEVRAAYTKIRHIAVERFKRLERFGYTDRKAYQNAVLQLGSFPTIASIGDAELRQVLIDTSRWLRDPMSKAGKVRSRDIALVKTFRGMGYNFVNRSNINDFLNFLNEHQEAYQERNFDYHKIMQAYGEAERLNVPRDYLEQHFEEFLKNQNILSKIEPTGDPDADSEAISKALGLRLPKGQKAAKRYNRKRSYGKR